MRSSDSQSLSPHFFSASAVVTQSSGLYTKSRPSRAHLDLLHELVRHLEVVERVDREERRGVLRDLQECVDRDETCKPERGRMEESRDVFDRPCGDALQCLVPQVCVYALELLRGNGKRQRLLGRPGDLGGLAETEGWGWQRGRHTLRQLHRILSSAKHGRYVPHQKPNLDQGVNGAPTHPMSTDRCAKRGPKMNERPVGSRILQGSCPGP